MIRQITEGNNRVQYSIKHAIERSDVNNLLLVTNENTAGQNSYQQKVHLQYHWHYMKYLLEASRHLPEKSNALGSAFILGNSIV